jgi:hypothetical protein
MNKKTRRFLTPSLTPKTFLRQISALAARARMPFTSFEVRFDDLHIELIREKWARVWVTAQLMGIQKRGERVNDTRELKCRLQKLEGKWPFTHVESIEVLER